MKTPTYNSQLEKTGEADLSPAIFEVAPEVELIQQAVRTQLANARETISNTKTRGDVSGGGKKPWKQKGTGRARAGSTRGPIWRHGGVALGPTTDRNWSLKMNKKQWRKALYMVLSDKAASSSFIVFSELAVPTAKTKDMVALLKGIGEKVAKGKKAARSFLFVLPKLDANVARSSSNLKSAKVISANSLNVVDLLKSDAVLVPQASLAIIEKTYLK